MITSKDAVTIGSGITRFEFKGLTFALSVAGTGIGPSRTVVGVKDDDVADNPDDNTKPGFYVQFESDSFSNATNDGAWNGISALIYVALDGTRTVLARWQFDTLNWDSGTQNFTPVLDVTLDLTPVGYSLTIEGDTIKILSGALSGSYASAGFTNELTTGYAYVFNQSEFPLINLSVDRIIATENVSPPMYASNPNPEDGEGDVVRDVVLSWNPGELADKHNVFFGTDFNDVNNATISVPLDTEVAEGLLLDSNSYDPIITLEYGKTYYWRVDEVNAPQNPGTYKGDVWSFTTELYSFQLPGENIKATANNGDPNNTINGSGLDPENPDQHNSTGGAMWVTNGFDPNGTWIRYDFDKLYKLDKMYVWNYNASFNNKYGIQDVLIQYSADNGQTWTDITSVTQFAKAPAKTGYTYNTVVPFDGAAANSVLITELSNFVSGSKPGDKAGLSEVRFYYIPVRARKPSPATGSTNISVTDTTLSWRAGRDGITHRVYVDTNENAVINSTSTAHTVTDSSYMPSSLNLGHTYYWCVNQVNTNETPSVWQSDIWNFSTEEYRTIDDFEDYNDNQFQGYAIFNTWGDGFDSPSSNGALIGNQESTPFCETVIVEHGRQSAPVFYNNSGTAVNSEVYRDYSTPQNWSAYGADTFRLYYRGKAVTFQQTSDGLIAMSGGGTDIWNNSDQFRFVYKSLNGNGSITARVDTIENTNVWAKAGVMIRNTLDANSVHAMSISAASGTASFQRRVTKGGASTGTDVTGLGHPYWVKITRSGNTLTAQRSADGINWYSFGADPNVASTETISMNTTVYIGLAVTSHSSGVLAAATFSNISTTGTVTGNWTVANIGDTTQAEGGNTLDSLYVSLTDSTNHSKKVFAPGNALGSGSWVQWEIPLSQFSGVTLSQIKKLAIGAGDSSAPLKGKGEFYMDNIGFGHTLED